MRSAAAIDRVTGAAKPHKTACLEFASNAGLWGLIDLASEEWEPRVRAAFRVLADSGFGGERSRGWGRAAEPEFSSPPDTLLRQGEGAWWLLSMYSPAPEDAVDWNRGYYSAATRAGWIESPAGYGFKKQVRMIEEGSVLVAPSLRGSALDVAPDGFAHPIYRAGFALAVPVALQVEA